jgi:hypothetical protein
MEAQELLSQKGRHGRRFEEKTQIVANTNHRVIQFQGKILWRCFIPGFARPECHWERHDLTGRPRTRPRGRGAAGDGIHPPLQRSQESVRGENCHP